MPVISSWNAADIIDNNENLYIGRPEYLDKEVLIILFNNQT